MWNIALNNEEIKKLASCTVENVESNQLVVQWGNNLEGRGGEGEGVGEEER